jgi:hypothetical protein
MPKIEPVFTERAMRGELRQLIERHNTFARIAGLKPLKTWRGDPKALSKKIYVLRRGVSRSGNAQAEALQHAAIRLLCHIDYIEKRSLRVGTDNRFEIGSLPADECRTVGLSYEEVRRRLREKYPECIASVHALRWYVSHIREGDYGEKVLPQRRPRKKPSRR